MTDEERHLAAQHAMQSGVAVDHARRGPEYDNRKHLRVGINTALCDHAALAKLLVSKGLITRDEYLKAIADEMEEEQAHYERKLGVNLG